MPQTKKTQRRNEELGKVYSRTPGFACQGPVGQFMDCYLRAEVIARKIQKYHKVDKEGDEQSSELPQLYTPSLRSALQAFSMKFSDEDIKVLFHGGRGERGEKSARQLRNGYLHTLSEEDRQEITFKATKYKLLLMEFLSLRL